ncbi:chemotaxis protein CheC [Methanosalsum natronophilum]|nr:chemotaxis protein CheC [Methanosalsum natronophilum]MCS3922976.1 chemotaxis protein CheC [Methanosalsum natronophilum]
MNKTNNLTEFQHDSLCEIANIGFGNAATSLSKLVGDEVAIKVPSLQLQRIEKIPQVIGGEESVVYGIVMQIYGDLNGYMTILLPVESVNSISSKLLSNFDEETKNEMIMSMMEEIGHILGGTYVTSLSNFLNMNISIDTPSATYDMAGAILDLVLIEMSKDFEHSLVLDTEMKVKNDIVEGNILVLVDTASLKIIMDIIDGMVS